MIKRILSLLLLFVSTQLVGWGTIGHRTIGQIAEQHLTEKAKKKIRQILDGRSLAYVSNWMDEVRSDTTYHYGPHWVTIPDGMTYEESEKDPRGDVIQSITHLIIELKTHSLDHKTESEDLKMLVHLIGDIHQPLHVGTGKDQGGNDIKLKWFGENTNLHSVWDSRLIDGKKFSYTELAHEIDLATPGQIKKWQDSNVVDWAYESMQLRPEVYDLPADANLGYEYSYRKWHIVELRLLQAGIRLAGVLNDIYGG